MTLKSTSRGRAMSQWQDVRGYEGRYQVSSSGELRKTDGSRVGQQQGRYMQARLSGPRRTVSVHRLVAEAFLPNPQSLPVVNHIDCNPHNNSVENLEWCTQAKNLDHSRKLGRVRSDHNLGVRSANARLSDAQVREIRRLYAAGRASYSALASQYEMSKRAIGRIVLGETYADL